MPSLNKDYSWMLPNRRESLCCATCGDLLIQKHLQALHLGIQYFRKTTMREGAWPKLVIYCSSLQHTLQDAQVAKKH